MNIAVDCRYIGKSGMGRVCEGVIDNLDYSEHTYYLIGKKEYLESYKDAKIIEDNNDPYSVKGILGIDKSINKICDAIIIPNFLIPLNVKIPAYTIMHDLAFLDVKVTTKGFIDKKIKSYLLKRCMKKSKAISCVSNFTVSRCKYYYKKYAGKCYKNYVGLCKEILKFDNSNIVKEENTIVFVGNVKPHKGLKTLIEAFKKLPKDVYSLKIIGEKENFLVGLDVSDVEYQGIEFTGRISDNELFENVAKASMLILPSHYEGFGVPPLEALYLKTKPIISDIEVFKEIYSDLGAEFFELENSDELCEKIQNINTFVDVNKSELEERFNYKNFVNHILEKIK